MRKRITAMMLAFMVFFTMDVESLYAVNGQNLPDSAAYETENFRTAEDTEALQELGDARIPGEAENLPAPETPQGPGDAQTPGEELPAPETPQGPGDAQTPGEELPSPETPQGPGDAQTPGEELPSPETPQGPGDVQTPGEELPSPETPQGPGDAQPSGESTYYTVAFDSAGGSTVQSLQIEKDGILDSSVITEPVRKGYLFSGWMTEAGTAYDFSQLVTADFVLKAEWSPITYQIRFDGSGGTGNMMNVTDISYDQEIVLPVNGFSKKGYLFQEWKTADGKCKYSNQAVIKNLTDQNGSVVVLKAVWSAGNYKIQFHANGGNGKMKELFLTYGKTKTLSSNQYKREGYTFAGWNTRKDGKGAFYTNKQKVKSITSKNGETVVFYAIWKGNPYRVTYDGNGASGRKMKDSSHIYGTKSRLASNQYKKRGYTFAGWNTKKDGTGTTYKTGTYITKLTAKKNATVRLYAKWKAVKYKITYAAKGGKMPKSYRKDYTVASKTFTLPRPVRKGYDFDGWYKDSRCKKRIGEVKKGTAGNFKVYAKWIKCSGAAKSNSAKITTCKAVKTGTVSVKAVIKRRVASSDDYYYLVYMNPNTKRVYKSAAKKYKRKNIAFTLKTSENQGYVTSMFGIAVKKGGKYKLISAPSYVGNPEKAAKNKLSYKTGKTKKGIQYSNSMQELYSCGAKNTFLNVTVSMVCNGGTVPYQYNGKTYYFNPMFNYQEIVSTCNRKKINVSMQVLLDWTDGQTDLIASRARVPGAAPFYTWNIAQSSSREKMEAIFSYLGMVFGAKKCYVSNWILGNEVNNPNGWNYSGGMSKSSYFKTYAYCFRALYYAVRSQYSNAMVFICVDNLWNTSVAGGYSAKTTITSFVKELKKIQKGLKWNLAYHAYSYPLTNTRFWNGYGISYNQNTPYITMNNLKVLTDYIKKHYGSSVRIILSEQGYTSTWSQKQQAAALAYSYYIAACNPMIDSFIIRSYSDHPVEAAQGLHMGISGKEAFKVFKYMDTSQSLRYTNRYLRVIGVRSWKQIVPGYSSSRIRKMYRKK